tara:strand:+ start:2244 stop:3002 length:759 start_codon:yes stop_codon:yes gene_type:complete
MVEQWLEKIMNSYNHDSYEARNSYAAQLHMPGKLFQKLVWWALQALPDEILIGLDVDTNRNHRHEVDDLFFSTQQVNELFQSQGYVISEAHIVNRGDSFSVHHLPEDWTNDIFAPSRGARAGRFTHWLHTHPNAPAIPSEADADASQETPGVDLILGLRFSPSGPLPWFDDIEGKRRILGKKATPGIKEGSKKKRSIFGNSNLPVIGTAPSGHMIHEIQLIAFHKRGLGVNIIFVDENDLPYGWESILRNQR